MRGVRLAGRLSSNACWVFLSAALRACTTLRRVQCGVVPCCSTKVFGRQHVCGAAWRGSRAFGSLPSKTFAEQALVIAKPLRCAQCLRALGIDTAFIFRLWISFVDVALGIEARYPPNCCSGEASRPLWPCSDTVVFATPKPGIPDQGQCTQTSLYYRSSRRARRLTMAAAKDGEDSPLNALPYLDSLFKACAVLL